jgi:hypothetical protein
VTNYLADKASGKGQRIVGGLLSNGTVVKGVFGGAALVADALLWSSATAAVTVASILIVIVGILGAVIDGMASLPTIVAGELTVALLLVLFSLVFACNGRVFGASFLLCHFGLFQGDLSAVILVRGARCRVGSRHDRVCNV